MIKLIRTILKGLHSNADPSQLTLGFGLGMILGLTPFFGMHTWIVIALVLLFKFNLGMFLFGWAVFKGLAFGLDPAFDSLGYSLLTMPSLQGFWTTCYSVPTWRALRFHNSVMLGSLAVSLAALIPMCLVFNFIIRAYRARILKYVKKSKLLMVLTGVSLYDKLS